MASFSTSLFGTVGSGICFAAFFFYRRGYHCWFFSVLKKRPSVRAVAWDGLFMGLSAVLLRGECLFALGLCKSFWCRM